MNRLTQVLFVLLIILMTACSSQVSRSKKQLDLGMNKYIYADKNGSFAVSRQVGFQKGDDKLFVKRQMEIENRDRNNILEQSVVYSNPGYLKGKTAILRPEEAQYSVWFEGKKYSSHIKISPKNKGYELKTFGPDSRDKQSKIVPVPKTKKLFCFFSQVTECLAFSGFIKKAIETQSGSARFMLIWDGYPYFQEAYNDIPVEMFSNAELNFDGKINEDEFRFNLVVGNQSIFYVLGKSGELKKMFWIAQGVSMVRKDLQDETNE